MKKLLDVVTNDTVNTVPFFQKPDIFSESLIWPVSFYAGGLMHFCLEQ